MSPDHRRRYEVTERAGQACLALEGAVERCYEGLSLRDIRFSSDSRRMAFPVRDGDGWRVIVDGDAGPRVDGLGAIEFSPLGDRLAYAALRRDAWHVVVDGFFGEPFEAVYDGSLRFDPSGRRLAYAARKNDRAVVIVDGRVLSTHDGVGIVRFSPDGSQLAYVARDGVSASVVIDGAILATHDRVMDFRFSPDGDDLAWAYGDVDGSWVRSGDVRLGPFTSVTALAYPREGMLPAFVMEKNGQTHVRFGAHESEGYAAVESAAFGTRGSRWGFVAHDSIGSVVILEDTVLAREEWASQLVVSPDGHRYAYVAQRAGLTYVVHDLGEAGFDVVVPETLMFVDDGTRWACLAGDLERKELHVVVEGIGRTRSFDWSEAGRLLMDSGRDGLPGPEAVRDLRAWVAAEAALLLMESDRSD